jgi:hypothetical protein
MWIKNLKNTAFTLLEVLLASIIFIISIAGVFATLNVVRTPVGGKEKALAAAILSKQIFEGLRSAVDEDPALKFYTDCPPGNCIDNKLTLALGTHLLTFPVPLQVGTLNMPASLIPSNGPPPGGSLTYTVQCADGVTPGACGPGHCDPNGGACNDEIGRRVDLNINY